MVLTTTMHHHFAVNSLRTHLLLVSTVISRTLQIQLPKSKCAQVRAILNEAVFCVIVSILPFSENWKSR